MLGKQFKMAEASSKLEDFLPFHLCEDLVCCVVCFEPFSNERIPKALPCLHSFCRTCLWACIQSYQQTTRSRYADRRIREFPCPICKDVTKVPATGLDGFRDDFRIRRISEFLSESRKLSNEATSSSMDNLDKLPGDDEGFNGKNCGVCKESYITKNGKYCIDCFKMMCPGCAEAHLAAVLFRDHRFVDVPEESQHSLPWSMTCPQHSSEPLRYYCKTCEVALCATCSLEATHKSHSVGHLVDETATMKDELSSYVGVIWKGIFDMERRLEEIESLERELKTKEVSVKRAILSKTLEEIFKARQRQQKMTLDLEEACCQKMGVLKTERELCKKFVDEARTKCVFAENVLEHGHDLHVLHTNQSHLTGLKELAEWEKRHPSSLEKLTSLGKYDTLLTELYGVRDKAEDNCQEYIMTEMRSVVSEIRQLSATQSSSPDSAAPKPISKTNLIKKIGKKGTQEGEFSFPSGVTFLPSGELFVADMHNHRIQVFSADGRFLYSFGSSTFKPSGIITTPEGYLAVTDCCTGKSGIKIFTPQGELKKFITDDHIEYPFSLAIDTNKRYVVCDSSTNRIVIIKRNGDFKRSFPTKTKFAFYLTVNSKNEIFLSDWFNHRVNVFNDTGVLLRTIGVKGLQDGQLMTPLGLCLDKDENILVLDCKCGRVSAFTADGKFLRQVVAQNEGIEYSRAVAVSGRGVVAVSSGDNRGNVPNEVRLYRAA